jgi:hypothetical protein
MDLFDVMNTTKDRNNVLKNAEFLKLAKWLEERKELFDTKTAAQIAEEAEQELNFKISVSNIRATKKALGIEPKVRVVRVGTPDKTQVLIAENLAKVMDALGMAVPDELKSIANSK